MSIASTGFLRSIGLIALGVVSGATISAFVTFSIVNTNDDVTNVSDQASNLSKDPRTNSGDESAHAVVSKRRANDSHESSSVSASDDNPIDSWNTLINDGVNDIAQVNSLLEVAGLLVDQEGIRALDQIVIAQMDKSVRDTIMKSVAHNAVLKDPQSTFHDAMSLSREAKELALPAIVKAWATVEPRIAFEAISNLEKSGLRARLQETLIGAWADNDPQDLFDSLEFLPERLRAKGKELAMLAIASSSPADAIQFLESVEDLIKKRELATTIATHWAQLDVYEALNWAMSSQLTDERTRHEVLSILIRELASVDPELALQTALSQPLYESVFGIESGLEKVVIAQVAKHDLNKAISMLSQVREGDTRIEAYKSVARELVLNAEYDRALELGQQLADDDREDYLNTVFALWAQEEPIAMFESLNSSITDPEMKAKAAATLLTQNLLNASVFDKDQVEQLTSMVGEGTVVTFGGDAENMFAGQLFKQGETVIIPMTQNATNSSTILDAKELQKSLQKSAEESLGNMLKALGASAGNVEVKTEVKNSKKEDSKNDSIRKE